MLAKKVKRMCNVKGCRNTDTYAISRIKEFGGVIICKSCLEEALKATEEADKQVAVQKKQKETPLFYHPMAVEVTIGAETKAAEKSGQKKAEPKTTKQTPSDVSVSGRKGSEKK